MNVWNLLDETATRSPDRTALGQADRRLSYRQAADRALALAARLRAGGVRPGDRVGCLMQNDIEHFLAYFGIAAAGAILVSLNTRLVATEQRDILGHAGATMIVHDGVHTNRAEEVGAEVQATTLAVTADACPAEPFAVELAGAEQPAQLYYTSGTTGKPKGVVLTHANVCTHARSAIEELQLQGQDTWAHIAPMFHLADAWATFAVTAVGGRHVFLPHFTARAALDLIAEQRVTITNLVPTMLNLMVKEPDAASRRYALRVMLSGGAPIAPDVVRRILTTFGCDYVQTYGMTETSPYLTLSLLPPELRQLPLEQRLHWQCKTGRAFRGIALRVIDDAGQDVAPDAKTVGEIRVRGATVTPGYWQDPEATRAAFDDDGFLRTGDLATIDQHGFVDIVDRKKDVIKTGAETVYSVEVEHVLYDHEAVLECAVVGLPDATWGESVTAAVVLRPDRSTSANQLLAFCRGRLAGFKAPKRVFFLDSLPRTGSGKIQKRVVRDALLALAAPPREDSSA